MTDVAVLVSPTAGRGRAGVLTDDVLAVFRAAGLSPRLLPATTGATRRKCVAGAKVRASRPTVVLPLPAASCAALAAASTVKVPGPLGVTSKL